MIPLNALEQPLLLSPEMEEAGFSLEERGLVLTSGPVRVSISLDREERLRETFQMIDAEGHWIDLLDTEDHTAGSERISYTVDSGAERNEFVLYDQVRPLIGPGERPELVLTAALSGCRLEKKIIPQPESRTFHVQVTLWHGKDLALYSLESRYRFIPAYTGEKPDFVWTPCLRPNPEDVIADFSFRSPALIVQEDRRLAGLIPDLDCFGFRKSIPAVLDLSYPNRTQPVLSYGLAFWEPHGHLFYKRLPEKGADLERGHTEYAFHLLLGTEEERGKGFQKITRFLWDRYAPDAVSKSLRALGKRLQEWENEGLNLVARTVYQAVDLPKLKGGLLRAGRARWTNNGTDNDAWFTAWFQSLRTAYGIQLFGRTSNQPVLEEMAKKVWETALCAPAPSGLFPSLFCLSDRGDAGTWFPDSRWSGHPDCFHAFDCSWTACWHLKMLENNPSMKEKVLHFLTPYAEFLLKHQLADGSIPAWFDAFTLAPRKDVNAHYPAETAASSLFLARFYRLTKETKYLNASIKALGFIHTQVVQPMRWMDFETFLTKSRKPFDFFDRQTQQFPQGTLSMFQAAWAYLELFKITRKPQYLDEGRALVDYIALFQQVWSPPFLSAPLFGGIGTQNTESEWSDARACYAADLFFDYFEETQFKEYFERGAAALRSVFPLLPHSNWGPGGEDVPGSEANYHLGLGSSAASSFLLRKKYGDIYVNLEKEWACPLDACSVQNLQVDRFLVSFDLSPKIPSSKPFLIKFSGLRYGVYRLRINNRDLGTLAASELDQGISFLTE